MVDNRALDAQNSWRWLPKISLDQLQHFIRVMLGSMSIELPRPYVLARNNYYKKPSIGIPVA